MPWSYTLCQSGEHCPGRVQLVLKTESSELQVQSDRNGQTQVFPVSMPALLGAQRGTRTHLVSQDGECIISKEADGVWITVQAFNQYRQSFFVDPHEYLQALTGLVEAKVLQRKISLQ